MSEFRSAFLLEDPESLALCRIDFCLNMPVKSLWKSSTPHCQRPLVDSPRSRSAASDEGTFSPLQSEVSIVFETVTSRALTFVQEA